MHVEHSRLRGVERVLAIAGHSLVESLKVPRVRL